MVQELYTEALGKGKFGAAYMWAGPRVLDQEKL
jgi:hypothetical protein